MRSLYSMLYANECYVLLLGVLMVTVTLLKRLLDMQFYGHMNSPLGSAGASGGREGAGGLALTRKNAHLGGAVARVFPNVSLAMCPLKLFLAPLYTC